MENTQAMQAKAAVQHSTESNSFLLTQVVTATQDGSSKRVEIGSFQVIVPTIERFIQEIEGAKVTGTDSDGLPVYDNDAANFLQSAITAACKMNARNKLAPKSAKARDGLEIPTTFAKLVEPAQVGGSNALAAISDLVKGFTAWMVATGKPAAVHATFGQLLRQQSLIGVQSDKVRQVLATWLSEFGAAVSEAGSLDSYQEGYLMKAISIAEGEEDESLEDLLAGF